MEQAFDGFDDLRSEIGERHVTTGAKGVNQLADLPIACDRVLPQPRVGRRHTLIPTLARSSPMLKNG
jgi:hypothetical protein